MFWRKRSTDDFAEEIKAHLELEADELRREGLSEDEARRAARREFGNVTSAQERFYVKGRWVWMDKLWRDVRFGLRWIAAESRVCDYGDSDAGAWGGGEYGGVQRDECGAAAVAAGAGSGAAGVFEDESGAPRHGNNTGDWETSLSYPVYDALRQRSGVLSELMVYVPLSISKVAVRIGAQPEEAEATW